MTQEWITDDGRVLDEETINRLADQADAGFPDTTFTKPRMGRPWEISRTGPSHARTVRIPQALDAALIARARADGTTPSDLMREALQEYLLPA